MHFKDITSKDNSVFKLTKSLSQKKNRHDSGLFLLEGTRLIEEAIAHGVIIEHLIVGEMIDKLPANCDDCQVLRFNNKMFREISDTVSPQGVIAVAKQIRHSLADLIIDQSPLFIVLNGIQDPGNLGTIIRTSAAANASAVLLTEGTVDLYNSKVIRATMGALFQIPIITELKDSEAINWLKYNKVDILVADLDTNEYYFSVNLKEPVAIIIGNENKGPSHKWKEASNKKIKIPILGSTESLNAAVAAGIIIYDVVRQRYLNHGHLS
ncbi:MAG: hypothetical protein APF76_09440 [Desulfitibacter sp. BRH_c19]|nr:MAG: hypothetical protein APF76_09440 [Desulfitibacter sp. BRH_c19]